MTPGVNQPGTGRWGHREPRRQRPLRRRRPKESAPSPFDAAENAHPTTALPRGLESPGLQPAHPRPPPRTLSLCARSPSRAWDPGLRHRSACQEAPWGGLPAGLPVTPRQRGWKEGVLEPPGAGSLHPQPPLLQDLSAPGSQQGPSTGQGQGRPGQSLGPFPPQVPGRQQLTSDGQCWKADRVIPGQVTPGQATLWGHGEGICPAQGRAPGAESTPYPGSLSSLQSSANFLLPFLFRSAASHKLKTLNIS